MLHEVARSQCAEFFTAESDQHDRPGRCRLACAEYAADLEQRRGAGCIVVRAVMDPPRGVGVERSEPAHPEVIVVRAHDDEFAAPLGGAAGDHGDHIPRRGAREVRV